MEYLTMHIFLKICHPYYVLAWLYLCHSCYYVNSLQLKVVHCCFLSLNHFATQCFVFTAYLFCDVVARWLHRISHNECDKELKHVKKETTNTAIKMVAIAEVKSHGLER